MSLTDLTGRLDTAAGEIDAVAAALARLDVGLPPGDDPATAPLRRLLTAVHTAIADDAAALRGYAGHVAGLRDAVHHARQAYGDTDEVKRP